MVSVSEGKESCVEKYISKGYFEKKSNLDDSEFDNYVKHEISSCSCQLPKDNLNYPPRLLTLHRNLMGEGSHRRLSSSIRLESEHSLQSCEGIIIEKLPSGVFADPFELQHLVHRKVFSDAAVFGDSNLELPSFRSNRSVVEIHTEISSGEDINSNQMEIKIELPLHARYPPLGEGFAKVKFGIPDIFLRCSSIQGNLDKCGYMPRKGEGPKSVDDVWEVPCGNKEHQGIVSVVTFTSAIISASLIVFTSISHSTLT